MMVILPSPASVPFNNRDNHTSSFRGGGLGSHSRLSPTPSMPATTHHHQCHSTPPHHPNNTPQWQQHPQSEGSMPRKLSYFTFDERGETSQPLRIATTTTPSPGKRKRMESGSSSCPTMAASTTTAATDTPKRSRTTAASSVRLVGGPGMGSILHGQHQAPHCFPPKHQHQQQPRESYYQSVAQLSLLEFERLAATQSLDQLKTLWSMRAHAMKVLRFGHDSYSTILLEGQAKLLGLSHWQEVLSPEDKAQAMAPAHTSNADLERAKADMHLMVQPWENNLLPFSYTVCINGEAFTYCNDRYRTFLIHDPSELSSMNTHQLYAPLLWGRSLCQDDLPAFFGALVRASYASTVRSGDCSLIVKCVGPDGTKLPVMCHIRTFFASAGMGFGISMEELPPTLTEGVPDLIPLEDRDESSSSSSCSSSCSGMLSNDCCDTDIPLYGEVPVLTPCDSYAQLPVASYTIDPTPGLTRISQWTAASAANSTTITSSHSLMRLNFSPSEIDILRRVGSSTGDLASQCSEEEEDTTAALGMEY